VAETLIRPLQPAPEARDIASSPATDEPTATILVCDDHADIVDMLVSVLQLEGFQPVPAYCGTDALHAVQQRHIDLVLLDKAMPDIDGLEVCRQIKEMFPLRFLPVILVTAKAHRQDKLAGLSLGADDYITKPFDLEELLAKVRVMLRIKRVEDQLFQRNIALASFNAVAGVVGESLILEEMLHNSLAEILRLMDLPAGWIFLWEEQAHASRLAVYLGVDAPSASSPVLYATDLLYQPGGTAATRHECDWLDADFRARNDLQACISIPLKSKGRVLGFMNLASRHPGAFQPRGSDLQVLESLGFELGVAVEHALLYQDARHMVEQLREVDRLKSRFISTASHEFRTPLSIIKGFANLLMRKENFGFDDETEKQYLGLIDSQIDALTGLVEDMLSAARIESGHAEVQAQLLDLAPLIERTATPAALQARHRDIAITVEAPPGVRVLADPRHVEQTVSNLLSNAVKYSDNGTAIRVCVGVADGMARVDVVDQGVGISSEQLPRLFERFTRLENRRSVEAGGTGLGLYIAKHWVEANGGCLWAESSPDRGSTFSFTLPVASSQ